MGREGPGDFTSFILFSPSSLDEVLPRRGCHYMGAGTLVLVGWCQHRKPEEQAGDPEIADQRSLCIS